MIRLIIIFLFIHASYLASCQNMQKGFDHLESSEYFVAKQYFTDILKNYPNNKTARICQARAFGLSDDPLSALQKFKNLQKEYPDDYEIGLNLAEAYLWNKDYKNGLKKYINLLKIDNTNYVANLGSANALAGLNKNILALKFVNKAIKINPKHPSALNSKKYILIALAYKNAKKRKHKESYDFLDSVDLIEKEQFNAQQIRILLKDHRRVRGSLEYFQSVDNGHNIANGYKLHQSIGWTPKNRLFLDFSDRTTDNTLFPSKGKQTQGFIKNKFFVNENISLYGGIGLLQNQIAEISSSNILSFAKAEMVLNKYNFLNLTYGTEYLNYNTDHLLKNLKCTHYKVDYHIYTPFRIGLFSLASLNYISDGNRSDFLFLSLYYHIKDTPGIKTGINYTRLHFENQNIVYFSPDIYQAVEGFFHIENLHLPSKIQYKALLAGGVQKIENFNIQKFYRADLQLGYRLTKQFCLSMTYMYSNSAQANSSTQALAPGNYEFHRYGLRLDNTF